MKRTGTATSPLHGGHCPPWLFEKMTRLGTAIIEAIVVEFGTGEALARLSDPVWFQSFGSVVGFDWHSSGLTTVLLGALKWGMQSRQGELGLFIAGGKGRASLKTPQEIDDAGARFGLSQDLADLKDASRRTAKTDNALVQDGYTLYHHVFLFDRTGQWAVIQQGMDEESQSARRYHWLSRSVQSFVRSPHQGIVGQPESHVLDLTAPDNFPIQRYSWELARHPDTVTEGLRHLSRTPTESRLLMPKHHHIPDAKRIDRILYQIYEHQPGDYEELVALPGVGASTLRALAMVSEVVFGAAPTFRDPVRYSFAHGGKDAHPFPVNRHDYEVSLTQLETAIGAARLGAKDRMDALRRLSRLAKNPAPAPLPG